MPVPWLWTQDQPDTGPSGASTGFSWWSILELRNWQHSAQPSRQPFQDATSEEGGKESAMGFFGNDYLVSMAAIPIPSAEPGLPWEPHAATGKRRQPAYYIDVEGGEPHAKGLCGCIMTAAWVVESSYFQLVSAAVILLNAVSILLEEGQHEKTALFFCMDQAILSFYVFEILCRMITSCGRLRWLPWGRFLWNTLDLVVVIAGVLEQWICPSLGLFLPFGVKRLLKAIRLLRLLRVGKLVRMLLDSDLEWTEDPRFQSFMGGVIAFNISLMGMETDINWSGWPLIEQVLLSIYTFELTVKMKRDGYCFFACWKPDIVWNLLDTVIVGSSVVDTWLVPLAEFLKSALSGSEGSDGAEGGAPSSGWGPAFTMLRMLRLLRILRVVKLVKSIRPLYVLVVSMTAAVQGVIWVFVLCLVTLYAMAILSTRLIGHKIAIQGLGVPDAMLVPFKTVADSMFTLFRVMIAATSSEEALAVEVILSKLPAMKFCFVFYMVTSSWTLLSILSAVVSEQMISTTTAQEAEISMETECEDHKKHVNDLRELFSTIDVTGDGTLHEKEITKWLNDQSNKASTAARCRVPSRDVVDLLRTLSPNGESIDIERFTESMSQVGRVITQKSIMKLEARILAMTRQCDSEFLRVNKSLQNCVRSRARFLAPGHSDKLLASVIATEQMNTASLGVIKDQVLESTDMLKSLYMKCPALEDSFVAAATKLASTEAAPSPGLMSTMSGVVNKVTSFGGAQSRVLLSSRSGSKSRLGSMSPAKSCRSVE